MMVFIAQNLAPIMFASLIVFLLYGYPVAFALAANGILFFIIGVELAPLSGGAINLDWPLLRSLPDRMFGGVMANDTLLAIPFFTFMGIVLEKSGMAEDLLDTIGQLFGPVRGGLAYAVIIVGALLAATTGVVAASVIAMGMISLPIMLRHGYDRSLSSGVIAASGTLAQIIPPSLVLIVLADQLGRSVGDMYKGALLPGLVLTGFYILYIVILSIFQPHKVPALPAQARTLGGGLTSLLVALAAMGVLGYLSWKWLYPVHGKDADILAGVIAVLPVYAVAIIDRKAGLGLKSRLAQQVVIVLIPPLALIFLVLGTIFLGIATPTEGGAMGAVGALLLAAAKGRLKGGVMNQALLATTRLSAFVMFILMGARVFSLAFYGVNGHIWVEHLLTSLPGGEYGFLIAVSILVFLLAFFLDYFELAFIIVPLLVPAAIALDIDLIWFGVLLAINMQTSFMHPPFGFSLFFLRSVAPQHAYRDKVTGQMIAPVKTSQIYWGAIPFLFIQLVMIAVVMLFPGLVLHYKGAPIDTSNITVQVPTAGTGGFGSLGGLGSFDDPFGQSGGGGSDGGSGGGAAGGDPLSGPPPGLGGAPAMDPLSGPPPGLTAPGQTTPDQTAPAAEPATDLPGDPFSAPPPGLSAPAGSSAGSTGGDPLSGPPPGLTAPGGAN